MVNYADPVQILVVVANIQMRTLKTEVENGCLGSETTIPDDDQTSDQERLPAEFKHIT